MPEKYRKGIQNGKEQKNYLFTDDMTLQMEDPKESTKKTILTKNEISKWQDTRSK